MGQFVGAYPVHAPDPTTTVDALVCAHPEAWASFAAAAGRRMDGGKFYFHLKQHGTDHAADGIAALAGLTTETRELAERFVAWFEKLFYQPAANSAWLPDRLEYQFAAAAPEADGREGARGGGVLSRTSRLV